jgi:uncharacterized protein YdhG (YjbR/CyaY superfamily)
MPKPKRAKDIDGYISQFPPDVQAILQKVRTTISSAAPEAKETISYLMPAFKQHGILVYFAAWEKHIGLYPPISGDKALEKAVARYAGPKGNLQFPLNQRLRPANRVIDGYVVIPPEGGHSHGPWQNAGRGEGTAVAAPDRPVAGEWAQRAGLLRPSRPGYRQLLQLAAGAAAAGGG